MIVLTKKKILYTFWIVIMFIFAYAITGYNVTNSYKKETQTIQVVALPVDNKVIVIDAGHGAPDEGAESSRRNYRGREQFKNSIKSAKFIRTIWSNSNINAFR